MSMDALTSTALESLLKEILPKLSKRLASLKADPTRPVDSETRYVITEALNLLQLFSQWSGSQGNSSDEGSGKADVRDDEFSDEEALAMLEKEGVTNIAPEEMLSDKTVAEALADEREQSDETEIDTEQSGEISDDEALALLAQAEVDSTSEAGVLTEDAAANGSRSNDQDTDAEMSDEEALAMLQDAATSHDNDSDSDPEMSDQESLFASMDEPKETASIIDDAENDSMGVVEEAPAVKTPSDEAPEALETPVGVRGDMSDEEAHALMAQMEEPVEAQETVSSAGDSMSDEEAHALMAQMEEPVEVPSATKGVGDAANDMSDEDARALLAQMDEPIGTTQDTADAEQSPPLDSADDEALAMLREMGGDDAETEPAPPTTQRSHPDTDSADPTDIGEVEEFASSDFSSDPEMVSDFNSNAEELMETLDQTVLQLEQNPTDRETIEAIFRAAHTLKGASGMFGFKAIERVMHGMENLFDQIRKAKLTPDANTIDVVFQGLDVLRTLLEAVKQGQPSGVKTAPIVHKLSLAAEGKYAKDEPSVAENHPPTTQVAEGKRAEASTKKKSSTIRVDLERLDILVNLVGELVIDRTRFSTIEDEIRQIVPQHKVAGNLSETVQLFGRHMSEIHELVMKVRMVPIGNAFNKFPRIVRDLARQMGKQIDLYIDGESTELDKTLVEQIGDPLIHLIRNACDHGVEMPHDRQAAGKRPNGQVFLSARQEGNHIVITIEDDGKGMDVEAIRKKGIERGLIKEDDIMSNRDIFNLIFEPGFSTAQQVTTVSGRGVGMDVVKKQISKLKGLIDIDSTPGQGSTISIQLPLTLAIVQSLLVECQGDTLAVPLSSVVESVRITPKDVQKIGDAEVIRRHDKILPLMHLHEILGLKNKYETSWYGSATQQNPADTLATNLRVNRRKERLYVVIVGSGERRLGIVVDQLLNQQEMVIKPLGPLMKETPCVAGGAVLGDGEVVLVLDIQELEDQFRSKNRTAPLAA